MREQYTQTHIHRDLSNYTSTEARSACVYVCGRVRAISIGSPFTFIKGFSSSFNRAKHV